MSYPNSFQISTVKYLVAIALCLASQISSFAPAIQQLSHVTSSSEPALCKRIPFAVSLLASANDASHKHSISHESDENQNERSGHIFSENSKGIFETYETNLKLAELASQCTSRRHGRNSALEAYRLLKNMTHPDTVAYNSCLKAFAKSAPAQLDGRTAAEHAQKLLEEMMSVNAQQSRANQDWYQRNSNGDLSDDELSKGAPRIRVKPNTRSFTTVMDAHARSGDVEAALSVLEHLQRRYEESDYDVALQPNTITYNTVLAALAKSKGGQKSAEQAQQLLEDIPVEPDTISYNSVLQCIARSGLPNAGERAETLFRKMEVRPNARSYTAVCDAWSKSRNDVGDGSTAADRAHALLDEMKYLYQKTGDETLRPSCHIFSTVINAYAVSKDPFKAQKAYNLLQEMTDFGVDPNIFCYNGVLNACAASSPLAYSNRGDFTDAYLQNLVKTLYDELTRIFDDGPGDTTGIQKKSNTKNGLSPDQVTYGTFLKCGKNILWNDPSFCIEVFQEACRQGQVSFGVVFQLRQAVPIDIFRELLPPDACDHMTGHFILSNIPADWKRNVRERNKFKTDGASRNY